MKKVLSIAGSDCSGGAGIQSDIKTIIMHKMYAMSVITAITAQNTTGVFSVVESSPELVSEQLDAVFTDIFPDSVKIGMVSNRENIKIISNRLKHYDAKNIVLDPVMVSTSGYKLISDDAIQSIKDYLFPISSVITPNIYEAEILSGVVVKNEQDMVKSAKKIAENFNGAILIKGGHLKNSSNDLLYQEGKFHWFKVKKINNPNTHGTGCTLSSSISCNLANGYSVKSSISNAKNYINRCLNCMLNLGKGSGPINHLGQI